jgi:hypothetical protein
MPAEELARIVGVCHNVMLGVVAQVAVAGGKAGVPRLFSTSSIRA